MIQRIVRVASVVAGVAVLGVGTAASVQAQEVVPTQYQQVISANPFGLLLEIFNAEYERVITESSTAGIGGSYLSREGLDYLNLDAFWRFYPQGDPLDGWAFGAKAGVTTAGDGTYPGFGFDVNRSWLLGKNNNFYVGVGFGLKRLLGVSDDDDIIEYIPTFRIVNVGIAF